MVKGRQMPYTVLYCSIAMKMLSANTWGSDCQQRKKRREREGGGRRGIEDTELVGHRQLTSTHLQHLQDSAALSVKWKTRNSN